MRHRTGDPRLLMRPQIGDRIGEMIDSFFGTDTYFPEVTSWTWKGRWVDEDKYDITPKKSYYEDLIRRKQEQIDALKRQKENDDKYYESRLRILEEDKERLLRDRDNKNKNDG